MKFHYSGLIIVALQGMHIDAQSLNFNAILRTNKCCHSPAAQAAEESEGFICIYMQ